MKVALAAIDAEDAPVPAVTGRTWTADRREAA